MTPTIRCYYCLFRGGVLLGASLLHIWDKQLMRSTPQRSSESRHLVNHDLVDLVDTVRQRAFDSLPDAQRSKVGQYGTPSPVGRLMASMFELPSSEIRLLDAGAGVGSLISAFVDEACARPSPPRSIHTTAFELDSSLVPALNTVLDTCTSYCEERGVRFTHEVVQGDFIEHVVKSETELFFGGDRKLFNCAIQNPPYKKLRSDSAHRSLLRNLGIEVSNLYAAFVSLTMRLLEPGGELVAITPRSFCNGPYFNSFRSDFLGRSSLRRIHVFDSRTEAFGRDKVLQENVIVHSVAGCPPPAEVTITSSSGEPGSDETTNTVAYEKVVPPIGPSPFIYLLTDGISEAVATRMGAFRSALDDTGLSVSTGRVVDFRATQWLRSMPGDDHAPLIYPLHLRGGLPRWPVENKKKPNAIAITPESDGLLVPPGTYVLVKRFSSKEQRRRIEATVFDSQKVKPGFPIGFENHLNYFHQDGKGLERDVARGLSVYLNSSLVDLYFRLFSGHTQVNATDLRSLPFPKRAQLASLGKLVKNDALDQQETDSLFEEGLRKMARTAGGINPTAMTKKVQEASELLKQLGFPKAQHNERSALTLLSLLDMKPNTPWSKASIHRLGITQMMDYFAEHYGKKYTPNTRETVRRQTVHQFLEAGLIVQNADDPTRAVNSAKNVYEVVPEALAAIQTFGTGEWNKSKKSYLAKVGTLKEKYAQRRNME